MKFSRGLIAASLTIGLGAFGVTPAWAAIDPISADTSFNAVGLIVKYQDGVGALAANGQPTAENAAGIDLSPGRDIGEGWRTVSFDNDLTVGKATVVAQKLAADPRVEAVELDRRILPASLGVKVSAAAMAALKPATVVRSVKATDGWSKTNPAAAAVKLTWTAPANLSGAKVTGYRIEANDGSGWHFLTTSLKTTVIANTNLKAGVKYGFRVAAITKLAAAQKIGAFSTSVFLTPTSIPQAPVFNGPNTAFGSTSPSWASQNQAQSGGLPILGYTATATATGQPSVVCNAPANATTCAFTGLTPNVTYSVSLSVRNARGAAVSLPGVTPLDALFKQQWYLTSPYGINATNAWSKTMGSKSVVVAVLDTGITSHPDLENQLVAGYDFISDVTSAGDGDGWDPDNTDVGDFFGTEPSSWHGTHVAGIVAAQSNDFGVTGVAPGVKVQPVRVLGRDGGGTGSDLAAAIRWSIGLHISGVIDNPTPANVLNISMGTDSPVSCRSDQAMLNALASAKAAGVTVITAAGNLANGGMPATDSYPGNCYPTINVGATAYSGDRASYSNYSVIDGNGQMVGVDISAPGGDSKFPGDAPASTGGKIISTLNTGKTLPGSPNYALEEGTSMAAPIVSGVVALMYSLKPKITFDQVWEILRATATKFPAGSVCETQNICGSGIVNAGAAVAAAAALP